MTSWIGMIGIRLIKMIRVGWIIGIWWVVMGVWGRWTGHRGLRIISILWIGLIIIIHVIYPIISLGLILRTKCGLGIMMTKRGLGI